MEKIFIIGLTSWRIASLLAREEGPWGVLARLRDLVGFRWDEQSQRYPATELAKMMDCVWCSSIWISIGAALFLWDWPTAILYGLAASAVAIGFERWVMND